MRGLGFMIWQLANMPKPLDLSRLLVNGRVSWVSIKVLDGTGLYNAKGGNQKLLKEYWTALKDQGIEVGGWHYVYGDQPGAEGDAASAFYEEFKPAHWLIDAEGEYKGIGMAKKAKAYCDKLNDRQLFTALCSYRFPSGHGGIGGFPFSAFLNHDRVDATAPQVYWVDRQNPEEQTQHSFEEYKKLTGKPFIPIGSAFGCWVQPKDAPKYWWEPTTATLGLFRDWCERIYPAYGYYSLDYILKNNRWDWWSTITDSEPPEPPPPEISDHEKIMRLWQYAQEQGWDV